MAELSDIEEITAGLMETFRSLKSGEIPAKDAVEINNTAGKIISAYKVRIAYHALRQEVPDIAGLGGHRDVDAARRNRLAEPRPHTSLSEEAE